MIDSNKIAIFRKYSGDVDGWARVASAAEKMVISNADWYEINALVQDYSLVKRGLASERYADKLNARIENAVQSDEDAATLKTLIMQLA